MASTKIEAFLVARGAKPDCEVCGQNTWSLPQDEAPMVVKLPTVTPAPVAAGAFGFENALRIQPPQGLPQVGTMNAYIVACLNCGNIRFHAETVVKQAAGL